MADYHPLIARAVAGLDKNTGENRRALYERARLALVAQLRGVAPALEESEITRERLSLEEAIRKVEAEAARQAREAARPNLIKRTETPKETPRREEASPAPPPSPSPAPPPRAPLAPPASSPPRPVSSPSAAPPDAPFPPRPAVSRRTQDDAPREFRDATANPNTPSDARPAPQHDYTEAEEARLFPAPAQPPAPPRSAPPPPPPPQRPERHPLEEYGQLEPQIQSENLWALPLDNPQAEPADLDSHQSRARRQGGHDDEAGEPLPRQPSSYGRLIRTTLVLVLLAVVLGLGYWQRDTILGVAGGVVALFKSSGTPPAPREAATPSRPKITDRIGQPSPQPSGPPVAQRVVLYEEEPDDPQGKRFIGTVLWRTEMRPATPGRAPELAVRADIDVPERKMSVTLSLRRNTDASLPASHTIEIVFNLPADSASGGVQKVPGVLMKQAEQTRGVPLAGLAVPVTPGYFLIGLSSLESDMQRNVQLLKERSWFDIPIIYNNNRRAILAMEKGTPGEQAFSQAFAAWKQ